jgi:hypothetical protein
MNWLPHDSNERMTVLFALFLATLLLAMKVVALLIRRSPCRSAMFWFSTLAAPNSLLRCRPRGEFMGCLIRATISAVVVVIYYWAYWNYIVPAKIPAFVLGYLGAPVLLLLSSLLLALMTLFYLPSGRLFPTLHDNPFLMRSIADFWGHRWNLWFSDWFRYALLAPLRRRPALAVVMIFFVSGVMHEWVVHLPLYLVTGRKLFGTMMLYFLLQTVGLLLERRCFAEKPVAKVVLAWLVVFMPAPLVVNEGLLRAMWLWPG